MPEGDDEQSEVFEIWPENVRTVELFIHLRSQWQVVAGMGGVWHQGLRQEAIESVLRVCRIPAQEREAMMDDLLAMSDAAAEILNRR